MPISFAPASTELAIRWWSTPAKATAWNGSTRKKALLPHYVNASLRALSVSLVVYHQFVALLLATHGPDAYRDAVFTDDQLAALQRGLVQVDEQAVAHAGFWQDEFATLLAYREHYKTN